MEKSDKKNAMLMLYKLSHEITAYLIISFTLCLFIESLIPGMVSGNNGFLILSSLIFANILISARLGNELGISYQNAKKGFFLPIAIFISFMLIGNSLLKFSLFENLAITTSSIILMVIFNKIILEDKT